MSDLVPGRSDPGRPETRYAPEAAVAPAAAVAETPVSPMAAPSPSRSRRSPARFVLLIVAVVAISLAILAALRLITG